MSQWRAVASSVVGTSHRGAMRRCEDAAGLRLIDRWLVFAVSDGAGSAALGRQGALAACRGALKALEVSVGRGVGLVEGAEAEASPWLAAAHGAVAKRAAREGHPLRDYACTLLCGMTDGDAGLFAQVGDGVIVVERHGQLEPVTWPQNGMYANVTRFITEADHQSQAYKIFLDGPITAVAATTDGLQDFVLDRRRREVYGPFVAPLLRRVRERPGQGVRDDLHRFLDSPFINECTDDDKTLVLATLPREGGEDAT